MNSETIFDSPDRLHHLAYKVLVIHIRCIQSLISNKVNKLIKRLGYFFCFSVLEPYKYAGYPMLIKTIKLETHDQNLFSKPTPLLPAASELCYHTINCSALNAEELRREEGIEVSSHLFTPMF